MYSAGLHGDILVTTWIQYCHSKYYACAVHALETHPTSSLVSQLTSRTDDVVTCKINAIEVCCMTQ